jgi:hypothetical protein
MATTAAACYACFISGRMLQLLKKWQHAATEATTTTATTAATVSRAETATTTAVRYDN